MKLYLTALSILVLMLAACREEPALVRQRHEVDLVQSLRSALLESVEAEKSAVLATTDEESQAFATEARNYAAEINRLRGKLRQLITIDRRPEEIKRLDAFDAAWRNVEDVDKRLLALAVANTNLKATRLSVRDGAAALDRFVDALLDLERASSDPSTIRALSLASISALRVQSLLAAHIASPSNEEMTALESRIGGLSDEVERILGCNPRALPDHARATRHGSAGVEQLSSNRNEGTATFEREHQCPFLRCLDPREAPRHRGLSFRSRPAAYGGRVGLPCDTVILSIIPVARAQSGSRTECVEPSKLSAPPAAPNREGGNRCRCSRSDTTPRRERSSLR